MVQTPMNRSALVNMANLLIRTELIRLTHTHIWTSKEKSLIPRKKTWKKGIGHDKGLTIPTAQNLCAERHEIELDL